MTTNEDRAVYDAEAVALEGTPLLDRLDRRSLIAETELVAGRLYHLVGDVTVEESSPRLVRASAYARGQLIRFASTRTERLVVAHELAHVAHRRSGLGGSGHGTEYRAVYAEMAAIVYGERYGYLLRHGFEECGLPVHGATLPRLPDGPVVPLDVLAAATAPEEMRWL